MDSIHKDLQAIRESQIRMESDLKYHIKRTDLLETHVDSIEIQVDQLSKPMPLADVLKIAGTVAAIVASVITVIDLLKK